MSRTYHHNQAKLNPSRWSVPKWFKRLNRQEERAKQNQALRNGKDLPIFRRRDAYEYW